MWLSQRERVTSDDTLTDFWDFLLKVPLQCVICFSAYFSVPCDRIVFVILVKSLLPPNSDHVVIHFGVKLCNSEAHEV